MRGLERQDDPFCLRESAKRRERLVVGGRDVLGQPAVAEVGVLRADARVVEAGRDRMGVLDLPVGVREEGLARAVQDTDPS